MNLKVFTIDNFVNYHYNRIESVLSLKANEQAICTLKDLPWDSNIFGLPVCKIDYLMSNGENKVDDYRLKRNLIKTVVDENIEKYIFARVNTNDLVSINAYEAEGFKTVDIGINAFKNISNYEYFKNSELNIFEFSDVKLNEMDEVQNLSKNSFLFDRFHNDIFLDKAIADKIHSEWSKNSVSKKAADQVLIAKYNNKIISFLDLKIVKVNELNLIIGDYGLGATLKEFQKKGLFEELNKLSLQWFKKQGVNYVQMTTQISNLPSAKTYINHLGFILGSSYLTLRRNPLENNS
jgi:predicted acetyltransferase